MTGVSNMEALDPFGEVIGSEQSEWLLSRCSSVDNSSVLKEHHKADQPAYQAFLRHD